jgi:type IV secretory pathway VirB4 component
MSTKDCIAPTSFHFGEARTFRSGARLGCVSYLQIIAADVYDNALSDFLEADTDAVITMHVRPIDQREALKMIKRKITDLDSMKITEQKRAVRSGYDMDIMPPDLATYGDEAKNLLRDLQNRNEKMFLLTVLVLNVGTNRRNLENNVFQLSGIASKHNNALMRLDYMQEQGLMSSLPLGQNTVPIERGLTTSGLAMLIPFVTREIFQSGEALYYGRNTLSGNMIMADRKLLKNPNGLILGVPGSGKSFAAKREITNAFLITSDDIIVSDPEAEYAPLVDALHGQVVRISQGSRDYLNPMDINVNYSEDENPLALKSDFIVSMCELILGGKAGLEPLEKSLIDHAVLNVYRDYLAVTAAGGEPDPAQMPVLGDLYDELSRMLQPEAQRMATALEIYVHGSLNVFNHRTNVDIENRLVCFDLKELGKQLRKLGMLIVQDQVWNRVTQNRAGGKSTRYYMDEMHLLLKDEQTAAYSVEIWKRFRKWGGIPTGITQNVKVRPDRSLLKAA